MSTIGSVSALPPVLPPLTTVAGSDVVTASTSAPTNSTPSNPPADTAAAVSQTAATDSAAASGGVYTAIANTNAPTVRGGNLNIQT